MGAIFALLVLSALVGAAIGGGLVLAAYGRRNHDVELRDIFRSVESNRENLTEHREDLAKTQDRMAREISFLRTNISDVAMRLDQILIVLGERH